MIRKTEENNETPSNNGRVPHRGLHPDTSEHRVGVLNDGGLLSVAPVLNVRVLDQYVPKGAPRIPKSPRLIPRKPVDIFQYGYFEIHLFFKMKSIRFC
jgi:hypothetical protein